MSGTVVDRIRARANAFPDNVALIQGSEAWTFAELFARVDRLRAALHGAGIEKGDAVLAFLQNQHEAVEWELAALGSGLAWITLTARLTWPEVRGVVLGCRPKLLVTTPEGARKIANGLSEFPVDALPHVVVTGDLDAEAAALPDAVRYEKWLREERPLAPDVAVDAEDVARLRYTSGTTGSAKAAVLPHRVYHASLDNLLAELGPWTERDRALHAAPLTHGSGALLHPVLYAGGVNILADGFDVNGVLKIIQEHRITAMFTVPTMLSRLVSAPEFDRYDLSSLRALIYGGAPMPEAQLRVAVRRIGRALVHIYGMTEAPWPITILKPEDHLLDAPRLVSVGRPSSVCEVHIADKTGRELAAGEVGEIRVRGKNVMSGYRGDEPATRAVLKDGLLSTGDLGKKDADGFVYIVGRDKDVIISGGFNVYATEVESALSEHPGVLEVAVVGLPHDDWGELVTAFVVPKPGQTPTPVELDALARKRLSGYKCPRVVRVVDELPKNASGKIQKSELVRRFSSDTPAG